MTLGTGIFLSTIVLAVLILYAMTKDRWRWRRIVVCIALILPAILVLIALIGGGLYFWERLPQKVERQTAYAGLRLGISPDEVMYIKGYPTFVHEVENLPPGFYSITETETLQKKGKRVQDYQDWSYDLAPARGKADAEFRSRIIVTFNPEKTAVVAIKCRSNERLGRCPSMAGVRDGDSEEDVLRKLGNPTRSQIDGISKVMSYHDLNIVISLTKEKVGVLTLADWDPKKLPEGWSFSY